MKNVWKRLFYAVCPSVFYSRSRTSDLMIMHFINNNVGFPPELYNHLKIVHPQKWFDNESEALFFAIYDYLTRIRKYKVTINIDNRNVWVNIKISNNKHVFQEMTLLEFGNAYNIWSAYKNFVYYHGI